MSQPGFQDWLTASGPYPEYADELMLYGSFVGAWDIDSTWYFPDGSQKQRKGEWYFGWALGGMAVQDVLFAVGLPANTYGTSLRGYDPETHNWHVVWMQPSSGEFVYLIGKKVEDKVIQEGTGTDPYRRERWTFSDILPDSFTWIGEYSCDGGETWILEQKMVGKRK